MLNIGLLLFVALVFPLLDLFLYPRVGPGGRTRYYLISSAWMWLPAVAAAALAVRRHQPWSDLRLDAPSPLRLAAGFALVIAYIALALKQRRSLLRRPERLRQLMQKHSTTDGLIPRTRTEARTYVLFAVTAGISEEIVYRGFILWLATTWIGLWPALLATSLLFGSAHAYLGRAQVVRVTVVGAVFGLIAVGSASLWPVILLHIFVDLLSGDLGYRALRSEPFEQVRYERLGEAVGDGADGAALLVE